MLASLMALMDGVCVLDRTEDSDSVDVGELETLPDWVVVGGTEILTVENELAVEVPPVSFSADSADNVGGDENDTDTRVDTVSVAVVRGESVVDSTGDDVFMAATVFEIDGELVDVLLVVDDAVVVLDCDGLVEEVVDGVTEREIDTDAVDERETAGDGLAVDVFDDVVVVDCVTVVAPEEDSVQEDDREMFPDIERDGEPEPVAVCVVERDCDGLLELDICEAVGDPDNIALRDVVLLTDALLVKDGLLVPL